MKTLDSILLAKQFKNALPANQKAIVEMSDARSLAKISLSQLTGTDEEKKAVKDAYVAKAKELFNYASEDGEKLDLSNAEYLHSILYQIDSMNEETDGKAPDDEVIAEILNNFFVTEGEGENQTAKIKDFRRFTYKEMIGLADAVAQYGTEAQKAALADMITPEEMEDGQYARAIKCYQNLSDAVRAKYESFVDKMTTKEEVIELIDKMSQPWHHIPFDKIMEKFGNDSDVQAVLLKYANFTANVMSNETRLKLAKSVMQVDQQGNITFDKTKLPKGVDVQNVINILPKDCSTNENFTKMFKAIFMQCDLSNQDVILLMNNHATNYDKEMRNKLSKFKNSEAVKNGTEVGNSFIDTVCDKWKYDNNKTFFNGLYNNATARMKKKMIENGHTSDTQVIVKKGDSVDKIVKEYLKKHLDKVTYFNSCKYQLKYSDEKIQKLLNQYMNDFRDDIMADLGIDKTKKLKQDDIIDLDKIKWTEHQPGFFAKLFKY